jgi:hypothetical protein
LGVWLATSPRKRLILRKPQRCLGEDW